MGLGENGNQGEERVGVRPSLSESGSWADKMRNNYLALLMATGLGALAGGCSGGAEKPNCADPSAPGCQVTLPDQGINVGGDMKKHPVLPEDLGLLPDQEPKKADQKVEQVKVAPTINKFDIDWGSIGGCLANHPNPFNVDIDVNNGSSIVGWTLTAERTDTTKQDKNKGKMPEPDAGVPSGDGGANTDVGTFTPAYGTDGNLKGITYKSPYGGGPMRAVLTVTYSLDGGKTKQTLAPKEFTFNCI